MVSRGLGVLVPARGAPALGHRPGRMAADLMGTGKGGTVEEAGLVGGSSAGSAGDWDVALSRFRSLSEA